MRKIPLLSLKRNFSYQNYRLLTTRERMNITSYNKLNQEKTSHNKSFTLKELLKKENLELIKNKDIKELVSHLQNTKLVSSKIKNIKLKKINYLQRNNSTINNDSLKQKMNINFPLLDFSKLNLIKSESQSLSVTHKRVKNLENSFIPFVNLTVRKSNFKIKGVSEYSRNNKISNYSLHQTIKNSLKILKAEDRTIKGELNPIFFKKHFFKKKSKDTCFSKVNFISNKLGLISLFGVFDGHGKNGLELSRIVKEYFLDYFQNNNSIKVCLSHDNYYSILTEAFENCQNYLIKNRQKLNIDIDFSGVTCCIVIYPNDSNNKLYCANCGNCKCVLYSNSHFVKLSYPHVPNRPSESDRILDMKRHLSKFINNDNLNNSNYNNLYGNHNNENKNNNFQNWKILNYIEKINERNIFEKKKNLYLKKIIKLNISRSLGDLQAKELGIISEPEIVESNLKLDRGKICVIGTLSLWKFLSEEEVGVIARKHARENNAYAACRELEEIARERWKRNMRSVDDITVVIIFLELKR